MSSVSPLSEGIKELGVAPSEVQMGTRDEIFNLHLRTVPTNTEVFLHSHNAEKEELRKIGGNLSLKKCMAAPNFLFGYRKHLLSSAFSA